MVSQETGFRRVTESAIGGAFRVGGLEPGAYKITVQKEGFKARQVFDVILNGAAATRVDFPLEVGSTHETVIVAVRRRFWIGRTPLPEQALRLARSPACRSMAVGC